MLLGLIADGNRRWAKANKLSSKEGHWRGFLTIKDQIIPALEEDDTFDGCAIYCFSTENWRRSPTEVTYLMQLFHDILEDWLPELMERQVKILHAGRTDRIPGFLRKKLDSVVTQTAHHQNFTIHLCLDYGSHDEITRAVKTSFSPTQKTIKKKRPNPLFPIPDSSFLPQIQSNLDVPPLDCILRTGGEQRLSNFCLWQAAYAELFFLEKFLPDIKRADIDQVIAEFNQRQRRRGK